MNEDDHYVTRSELREELKKLPTRWETRFLILAGLIATQFLPASDVAKAALALLP